MAEDAAAAEVAGVSWETGCTFPGHKKHMEAGFLLDEWIWEDWGVPDLGLPFPFPFCLSWPLALGSGFALSFDFLPPFAFSFPFGATAALVS